MAALTDLGNNSGYLYVTDTNGTDVISSIPNTLQNARKLILDASVSVALPPNTGTYATGYGRRYFLNSGGGAVQGDLTGATEITQNIIQRGLESQFPVNTYTIASGVVTPIRDAVITVVNIETEGLAASDTLDTITTTDYNTGDLIIFRGVSAARVVTFSDGTGNLKLANNVNFLTAGVESAITFQYVSGQGFVELWRTPGISINVGDFRDAGLAQPNYGVFNNTMPTNGTVNLEAGVDFNNQVVEGSPVLIGSVVYQANPAPSAPYIDGDEMWIDYRATPTVGVNTVSLFGITLTTEQAEGGALAVRSVYNAGTAAWESTLMLNSEGVDLVDTTELATKEDSLGNPAANGYVLSSTTGGVRSWIPPSGGSSIVAPLIQTEITILSADVLQLNSVPYELIPTPGPGFAIFVKNAIFRIDTFGGVAYATSVTPRLAYGTSLTVVNQFTDRLQELAAGIWLVSNTSNAGVHQLSTTFVEDESLVLQTGASDPTAGNSDIVIWLEYQIIPV